MTHLDLFVRVTRTALGRGVIATRTLYSGQIIGEVRGTPVRENDDCYDPDYCIDLDGSRMLEPEPPFRFLNHSCEPNCQIFGWDEDITDESLWVEATREIRHGEELTIDYAWPAEFAIRCRCGSSSCREWIVAEEELEQIGFADNGTSLTVTREPKL